MVHQHDRDRHLVLASARQPGPMLPHTGLDSTTSTRTTSGGTTSSPETVSRMPLPTNEGRVFAVVVAFMVAAGVVAVVAALVGRTIHPAGAAPFLACALPVLVGVAITAVEARRAPRPRRHPVSGERTRWQRSSHPTGP